MSDIRQIRSGCMDQIECAESVRLVSKSMSFGMQRQCAARGAPAHRPVLSQVAEPRAHLSARLTAGRYSAR